MSGKRTGIVNVACAILALMCQMLISFLLTPYLIAHIGVEANGFVSLADNFINYANLIVTVLNSMAARFITIAYVQKDIRKARMYYNSVFWGNLIIVAVLLIPATVLIVRMERLISVPPEILTDVKILFTLVFGSFFLRTGFPNWDCATYVSNRLDRSDLPDIVIQILRCMFLVMAFVLWEPHVYYVGIGGLIVTVLGLAVGARNMRTLVPELTVSHGKDGILCSGQAIRELVGSGIWSSVSAIGNIMFTGVDLLVCNLFLGSTVMGVVAVAKTLPSIVIQFARRIRLSVLPQLTLDYAKQDKELIRRDLRFFMRILCFVMTLPLVMIVVVGRDFYRLWVPSQDAELLHVLSILACGDYFFTSGCQVLYNAFQVTNRVRVQSTATIICGGASLLLTLVMIRFTSIGIYAVAGVSALMGLVREVVFTIPYAAEYLGFDKRTFYPELLVCMRSCAVLIALGMAVRAVLPCDTWAMLIVTGSCIGVLSVAANFLMLFDREEKRSVLRAVRNRLKR